MTSLADVGQGGAGGAAVARHPGADRMRVTGSVDQVTSPEGSPAGKRPSPWRTAIVAGGVAVAVLALVAGGLSQRNEDENSDVPGEILALLPDRGTVAFRQDTIGADLQPLLVGTLIIDGPDGRIEIPEDQIEVRELGSSWRVTFRPGEGQAIEELTGGEYQATILWWSSVQGRPDTDGDGSTDDQLGSYTWNFTVS